MVKIIADDIGSVDIIAGVATGGIAIGALVAQELGLPFVYVRSSGKDHGLGKRIEGVVEPGQSVVVIEDLISTGRSSLSAVEALEEAGCKVKGMLAIFTYGFNEAAKAFMDAEIVLHTLCDYQTLIDYASEQDYILDEQVDILKEWRKSPSTWKA